MRGESDRPLHAVHWSGWLLPNRFVPDLLCSARFGRRQAARNAANIWDPLSWPSSPAILYEPLLTTELIEFGGGVRLVT